MKPISVRVEEKEGHSGQTLLGPHSTCVLFTNRTPEIGSGWQCTQPNTRPLAPTAPRKVLSLCRCHALRRPSSPRVDGRPEEEQGSAASAAPIRMEATGVEGRGERSWSLEDILSLHQPWAVHRQAHWVSRFSLTLQVSETVLRRMSPLLTR